MVHNITCMLPSGTVAPFLCTTSHSFTTAEDEPAWPMGAEAPISLYQGKATWLPDLQSSWTTVALLNVHIRTMPHWEPWSAYLCDSNLPKSFNSPAVAHYPSARAVKIFITDRNPNGIHVPAAFPFHCEKGVVYRDNYSPGTASLTSIFYQTVKWMSQHFQLKCMKGSRVQAEWHWSPQGETEPPVAPLVRLGYDPKAVYLKM